MYIKKFILTYLIDFVYQKVYINIFDRFGLLKGLLKKLKVGCMYAEVGCKVYGYFWVHAYAFSHIRTMSNQSHVVK